MNNIELKEILENHSHYLKKDCKDWEEKRAIFKNITFENIEINNAIFDEAIFEDVVFNNCTFILASFKGTNFSYVDVKNTVLKRSSFKNTKINNSSFENVNLNASKFIGCVVFNNRFVKAELCTSLVESTNIFQARVSNSKIINTTFNCSTIDIVKFTNIDFLKTIFNNSQIDSIELIDCKNFPFIPTVCPEEGSFIGYKKTNKGIVKLEIPADARRISGTGRKCRCDKAKVLGIYDKNRNLLSITETSSYFDNNFIYRVGEMVEEPDYCENRWKTCSSGIHFFINFQEAVEYQF